MSTESEGAFAHETVSKTAKIHYKASIAEQRALALSCWYLTGATASGKSDVSIALAKKLNAEIISLDSMAIYRGMDIGTAKPSIENQSAIRHYMIDILDPVETFSVSQYRKQVLAHVRTIQDSGKQVLFVGGTALYLKGLLRGMFDGPSANWEFRQQVETELASCDESELFKRLQNVDPLSAHKLHANDRRRIVRALEVFYQTGVPISHWQMEFDTATPADDCKVFTLRHPRPILHERIEKRVHEMFERGLVAEVEALLEKWNELGHTAAQAVGYREAIELLRGERDQESTFERVLVRTRRFARHQETWFRGLEECRILDLEPTQDANSIADQIYVLGN